MASTKLGFAAIALVVCGLPALADGPPSPGAPARERYNPQCCVDREFSWTGIFVGGHIGGGISHTDWSTSLFEGFSHGQTSFGGGVQAAAQYQWGNLVAGVEASYTWMDFDDTTAGLVTPGLTFSSNVSDLLIVAAKLGYAQDRLLFFTKAGYASADITIRSTSAGITNTSSGREDGWMLGIGLDYAVTNRIVLGVEYDWAFFNPDTRKLGALTANAENNDMQTLMARLMFKFGRD